MILRESKYVAQIYELMNNIPYDCCVRLNIVGNYICMKHFGTENIKLEQYSSQIR